MIEQPPISVVHLGVWHWWNSLEFEASNLLEVCTTAVVRKADLLFRE